MRHRFVHRAGTLALTLLMVALSTLMVGASGDRAKAEKASSLPEKEAVKTGVTVYSNAKASIDASNLSGGLPHRKIHRRQERAHQGADHQVRRHHLHL